MELYTFIMDYLGGTYISQIKAKSNFDAVRLWIRNIETKDIKGFTESDKQEIVKNDFVDEDAILIKGLKNVWHFLITTKKGVGYINFVKTKI